MRTINKIITKAYDSRGADMGRISVGTRPTDKKVFDCFVPMDNQGAYDIGGAYWGLGTPVRVSYTKDLTYVRFYRAYQREN